MPGNRKLQGRRLRVWNPVVCPATGKFSIETRDQAEAELVSAQKLRAAQGNPHIESKVYLCTGCMKYHLSSETKRKRFRA